MLSKSKVFIIFCLILSSFCFAGYSETNVKANYVVVNNKILDEKNISVSLASNSSAVFRFNNLNLPIKDNLLHEILLNFPIQQDSSSNSEISVPSLKLTYFNPTKGISKSKNLVLNIQNGFFTVIDTIGEEYFSEDGNIVITIQKLDDELEINIQKDSIIILGLGNNVDFQDEDSLNSGIISPTSEFRRQTLLNWNSFLQQTKKISLNVNNVYFLGDGTDQKRAKIYALLDFRYNLFREKFMNLSAGIITTASLMNNYKDLSQNTFNVYIASTKSLNALLDFSCGYIRGKMLSIFVLEANKTLYISSNSIFVNFALKVSNNSRLKIESNSDLENVFRAYTFSYSRGLFKNIASFDIGTALVEDSEKVDSNIFCAFKVQI